MLEKLFFFWGSHNIMSPSMLIHLESGYIDIIPEKRKIVALRWKGADLVDNKAKEKLTKLATYI